MEVSSAYVVRLSEVLPQEFVQGAVTLLVTRFIPLNQTELENWMNDPEEWVNSEAKDSDAWEFDLRVWINPRLYFEES